MLLITADHGNAEQMINAETGEPHTAHTTNPVPFIIAGPKGKGDEAGFVFIEDKHDIRGVDTSIEEEVGALCDVAPTVLEIMVRLLLNLSRLLTNNLSGSSETRRYVFAWFKHSVLVITLLFAFARNDWKIVIGPSRSRQKGLDMREHRII